MCCKERASHKDRPYRDQVHRGRCPPQQRRPMSQRDTPPKVVENNSYKILFDFRAVSDGQLPAKLADIMVAVDKEQKGAV